MTMSGIDTSAAKESASAVRSDKTKVDEAKSDAVSACNSVGKGGVLSAANSTIAHLDTTLESLSKLIEAKAEAMEYAAMGLWGPHSAANAAAETAAQSLGIELDRARSDPDLAKLAGLLPETAAGGIALLEATSTPAEQAAIFGELPVKAQVEIAKSRPDIVAGFVSELKYMALPVRQAFLRRIKQPLDAASLGVSGHGEASAASFYVYVEGKLYGQVTTNSDGSMEVKLAISGNFGAGKEFDKTSDGVSVEAKVGAMMENEGYVTLTFPPDANQESVLETLAAKFKDDVHIEGVNDMPVETAKYIANLTQICEDNGGTIVTTYVGALGVEGDLEIKASGDAKIGANKLAADAKLGASLDGKLIYQTSSNDAESFSAQISGEALASLSLKLKNGDDTLFGAGAAVKGQASGKVTFGKDSSGQKYVQIEIDVKGERSLNAEGDSGAEIKSKTITARIEIDDDLYGQVGEIVSGESSLLNEAEIKVVDKTTLKVTDTLAEGDGKVGVFGFKLFGYEYDAKKYASVVTTDSVSLKPPDGVAFDPIEVSKIAKSLPTSPP